jgi:hypothetical protein
MVDTDDLDKYEIYKILKLKVVCAGPTNLTVGQRFKITPHGLLGSDRLNDNGEVLIGLTKFSMDVTGLEVRNVINDLEIYHVLGRRITGAIWRRVTCVYSTMRTKIGLA